MQECKIDIFLKDSIIKTQKLEINRKYLQYNWIVKLQ